MIPAAVTLICLTEIHSYTEDAGYSKSVNEFCHVNNFTENSNEEFHAIEKVHVDTLDQFYLSKQFRLGSPFVVTGVTRGWKATEKWDHTYFSKIFKNEELFSSTFSTPSKPEFCQTDECNRNTYYGIFLNNPLLADSLSDDYEYPPFIPGDWWIKGIMCVHSINEGPSQKKIV